MTYSGCVPTSSSTRIRVMNWTSKSMSRRIPRSMLKCSRRFRMSDTIWSTQPSCPRANAPYNVSLWNAPAPLICRNYSTITAKGWALNAPCLHSNPPTKRSSSQTKSISLSLRTSTPTIFLSLSWRVFQTAQTYFRAGEMPQPTNQSSITSIYSQTVLLTSSLAQNFKKLCR